MKEKWLKHPVFVDYSVSDRGRVRRDTPKKGTYPGRIKTLSVGTTGYLTTNIEGKPRKIHVLVLETFVGFRPLGNDGCHNNGNRQDNRLANLRWASRSSNMQDARQHGTAPVCERHGRAKLTLAEVQEIRTLRSLGALQKDLAKIFRVSTAHVSYVLNKGWIE